MAKEIGCGWLVLIFIGGLVAIAVVAAQVEEEYGGDVMAFGFAGWVMVFAIYLSHQRRREEEEAKRALRESLLSRFEWLKAFLSRNMFVGTYLGGHPDLVHESTVLVEVGSDSMMITPIRADKETGVASMVPKPTDRTFASTWDRDLAVEIRFGDIEFVKVGADLIQQERHKDVLTGAIVGGVIAGETGAVIGALDALKPETVTFVAGDRLTLTVRDKDLGIREIAIAIPKYHPLNEKAIKALKGEYEAIVTITTGFSPVLNTLVARVQEYKKRARSRE